MVRVKSPQDFWAGILFICFGVLALFLGHNYAFGTATRMGPGFLPTTLSWILVILGLIIVFRGLTFEGATIPAGRLRPQIFVLAGIVLFGLLIERVGLAPTVFISGLVAAFASQEVNWKEAFLLAAGAAILSVVLFIYLLGQSMTPWMWSP